MWQVMRHVGTADELHHLDLAVGAGTIHDLVVSAPALVLGSTQSGDVLNAAAADASGFSVARRRSGGGLVALVPSDVVWIDIVIAADDPRWDPDVGRAAEWVGAAWGNALVALGVAGELVVHTGAPIRRELGRVVCFAGVGAGEVTVAGSKLVGISQRRGRWGARFQTVVHRRWDPQRWSGCVSAPPDALPSALDGVTDLATAVGSGNAVPSHRAIVDALASALSR
jgi:lipoate-protein ligase A